MNQAVQPHPESIEGGLSRVEALLAKIQARQNAFA